VFSLGDTPNPPIAFTKSNVFSWCVARKDTVMCDTL